MSLFDGKYGDFYSPHILFGRVVAVNPVFNQVKVRLRPPHDCLPDQWARVIQMNGGSPLTPTSQINNKVSNEGRTGFWMLPNVNDYVICSYIEGTPIEPNLICLGVILAPLEEKSQEANRFGDWLLHHSTESFLRFRAIDGVRDVSTIDSKSKDKEFSYNIESSRAEIEINNREGSIFRITEFSEGENLSDDEIYLRDTEDENPVSPLVQGRRRRNVDVNDENKEELVKGRGMVQLLHNTGGHFSFRNLEKTIEETPRLKIDLNYKNNYLLFNEEVLNRPSIQLNHHTGAFLKFSNNDAENSTEELSNITLKHPVGDEFVIDESVSGETTITLTQNTSSSISFDNEGNIEIDTTIPDKKITIKAENNTEVIIENGTITINSRDVTVNSENATINASTKAIVESPEIELGVGATEAVMKGNAFASFWGDFKNEFDSHGHSSGVGPTSGPITSPTGPIPYISTFDNSILSTIVKTK